MRKISKEYFISYLILIVMCIVTSSQVVEAEPSVLAGLLIITAMAGLNVYIMGWFDDRIQSLERIKYEQTKQQRPD
jgi:hypothetical protein